MGMYIACPENGKKSTYFTVMFAISPVTQLHRNYKYHEPKLWECVTVRLIWLNQMHVSKHEWARREWTFVEQQQTFGNVREANADNRALSSYN
jgi:hypothetical protein